MREKKTPLVSVVMCTYNGAAYVLQQLDSIINQTCPAHEIIIVDDASTDNTYSILLDWQSSHKHARLYRNEKNIGFNKNFEKAITLTSGDYISIADQDDIWLPEKTALLVEKMEADERNMLVHCRSASLRDGLLCYANHRLHQHFSGNDTRKLIFFNHINGHNMMFKKELLPLILPVPEKMFYDWWIAVIATTQGRIASVNKTLVHHRLHDSNAHFSINNNKNEPDHDEIIDNILKVPTLQEHTRAFAVALNNLIKKQAQQERKINLPFFLFLFKHRQVIFGHKKRFPPVFSYFKNSIKYAGARYKNSGVSF